MDSIPAKYRRAAEGFYKVVRSVPPGKWEAQSPCEAWKALDVVGHVIGIQQTVRAMAAGEPPAVDQAQNRHKAEANPVAAWTAERDQTLARLTPEVLERQVSSRLLGEVQFGQLLGVFIGDMVVHTWDLATAVGQQVRLDPDLVSELFVTTSSAPVEMMRRPGGFGPALPAPEGADEQTRLLAFLGRKAS